MTFMTNSLDCSQIRQGIAKNSKGTAYVVYEDVMDAKVACDKLNGFNFQNRYLVGTYSGPSYSDTSIACCLIWLPCYLLSHKLRSYYHHAQPC